MKPRILVLSQHYRPEPNFIVSDVAEALARHAEVTVVTAHPNYPTGRFYPGTRYWLLEKSTENGVTVWRVPFLPDHSTSKLRRMAAYLSFALVAGTVAPFVAPRPALVWVYQGPFTTMLAALWFKYVGRARVILTCADLWPESFVAAGVVRPGRLVRLAMRYRRAINRAADLIICSTRGTLERFAAEGIPRSRLCFVPVWVEGATRLPEPSSGASSEGEATVVYAGNLGPAQQLDTVIRAAALLESDGDPFRFDFYGAGAEEENLRTLARDLGLQTVRFRGRVPPEEAVAASSHAFAQIVSLRRDPLFAMTLPSKVSACLAAGAPILYALEGEAAEIVEQSGGGVRFDPDAPASFVASVRELLRRDPGERTAMRQRLRGVYREKFDPQRLLDRYVEIVLSGPSPATTVKAKL